MGIRVLEAVLRLPVVSSVVYVAEVVGEKGLDMAEKVGLLK